MPSLLFAAGNMGKDIEYVCLGVSGGNVQYQVTARYFWHCWDYLNGSASAPPPATLTLKATGCALNTTFTLNQDNTGSCPDQSNCVISPLCPAQTGQGACNWVSPGNPPFQGIRVFRYTATISLPVGCAQINLGIDECCRAGNVSNIANPTVSQGAVLAIVNTASNPQTGEPYCNNSPHFTQMPEPFVCVGSETNINYGVTETDNDSLVYSLITPLQGTTPPYTNATFNAAWNLNNPVRTVVPNSFGFNVQNGQMTFTPSTPEQDVITVRVNEYRNGVLVGAVMRDIVLTVMNCFSAPPIIHPLTSVTNATQISPTSFSVCPNTPITLRILVTDPTNKNISAIVAASPIIQAGITTTDSLIGTAPNDTLYKIIRWTPTLADTGCHNFSIRVANDDCPVNGSATQSYQICVLRKATVTPHNAIYCGTPVKLTASGGTNPTWTPSAGLSGTTGYTVYASPTLGTRYTFSSDCGSDTVYVDIAPIFGMDAGSGGQICRNGQIQLQATTTSVYPNYTIEWTPAAGLFDPISGSPSNTVFNPIASPYSTTTYTAKVTAPNGCSRTDDVIITVSGISPTVEASIQPVTVCPGEPVTLTAVAVPTACGMPISTCNGQSTSVVIASSPTAQTGAATQYPSPYGNYFRGARHQYLIRANELAALVGSNGGQIKSLAMNIAVLNSNSALQDFTIQMGCTTADSLTSFQGNLVTVFTPKNIIPVLGWNTHLFDQFYDWDGASNIVVDVCFYNPSGGALNNKMQVNPTTYRSQWFTWSNVQPMCGISGTQPTTPAYATFFERPSFRFNVCLFDLNNTIFQWTPSTGVNAPSPINNDTTTAHPVVTTTYMVHVTDVGGCTASDFVTAIVDTSLRFSVSPDTMVCNTSAVQLHAVAQGSPLPGNQFTYTWTASVGASPPSGTGVAFANPIVNPTQTTTYICRLTGGLCTLVDSVTVTYGSNIPTTIQIDSISCFNAADGKLRVILGGGTSPFSYTWSPNASSTTDSVINVSPGTYAVTVSDNYNCSGIASVQVTQPTQLTATVNTTPVSCYGGNNGSATANANGGIPPYTYNWSGGYFVNPVLNLEGDTYTVTVRDSKQCAVTASGVVGEPQEVSVSIVNIDSALCYNTASGTVTAATVGGTGTYTYTWSAGSSTTNINNAIPAGQGFVIASDANQCRDTTLFIVYQPTPVMIDVSSTPTSCATSSNGTGTVAASGGVGGYSYVWDGSPGSNPQPNLAAGTHTVVVSDANNCTVSGTVYVDTLYVLQLSTSSSPTRCFGSADGTAEVVPLNGLPSYQYVWSVGGSGSSVNAPSGLVSVTVTDGNACTATATVTISQPVQIGVSTDVQNPSCIGRSDGKAWATAINGVGNYSYGWSTSANTDTVYNLSSGTYQVTAYDANLCSATASATIVNPTTLIASLNKTDISCFDANDGAVSVSAIGGVEPYSYLWNDWYTQSNRTGISSGVYQITISDANACDTVIQVIFNNPSELSWASVIVDSVSCPYISDGRISVVTSGGNPAYSYSLNGAGFQVGSVFNGLERNSYTVSVRDANGCTKDTLVTVGAQPQLTFTIEPRDSVITFGETLQFTVVTNNYPYDWMNSFSWTPAEGLSCTDCLNPVFSGYSGNTYTLNISYNNGVCTASDMVTVYTENDLNLYVPNAFSPDDNGKNDILYVFGKSINSIEFRVFNRWGEKVFESNNLWIGWDGTYRGMKMPPGVYTYYVTVNYLTGKTVQKSGSITLIR